MKELVSAPNKKDCKDYIEFPQYSCFCFREDCVIMGTNMGELLIFSVDCLNYKQTLSSSLMEGKGIECIISYSKGFIVGSNNCSVYVYERNEGDPKKPYIRSDKKYLHPTMKDKVTSLLLINNEESLLVGLDNG